MHITLVCTQQKYTRRYRHGDNFKFYQLYDKRHRFACRPYDGTWVPNYLGYSRPSYLYNLRSQRNGSAPTSCVKHCWTKEKCFDVISTLSRVHTRIINYVKIGRRQVQQIYSVSNWSLLFRTLPVMPIKFGGELFPQ